MPSLPRFVLVLSLILGVPALASAADDKTPDPTSSEPAPAPGAKKKRMLEKGMEADTVELLYGKPAEIKPMETPDATTKAEQWIYRRKVSEKTIQTADTQSTIPTFGRADAGGVSIVDVPIVTYRLKHLTTYQVTALLMVNGRLEVAKQWQEVDSAYVN
ncbi:hypothetical protein [Lacunisphaera limnophila]|nr:hypothetical protein [Lacunisphaera limnophila]